MTKGSSKGRRRIRGERGQSLVEFALTIPLLFVLIFAIIDFSLGLRAWITITNSAREAGRFAAVTCVEDKSGVDEQGLVIQRAVATSAGLLTAANVDPVANCPGGTSGNPIVVTVHYTYKLITPLSGFLGLLSGGSLPSSISMSSTSNMRLE